MDRLVSESRKGITRRNGSLCPPCDTKPRRCTERCLRRGYFLQRCHLRLEGLGGMERGREGKGRGAAVCVCVCVWGVL